MVDGHYVLQGVLEPFIWVYPVLFADSKEGIDYCTTLGCIIGTCKQVIFTADVM